MLFIHYLGRADKALGPDPVPAEVSERLHKPF